MAAKSDRRNILSNRRIFLGRWRLVIAALAGVALFSPGPSDSAQPEDPEAYTAAPRALAQETLAEVMAVLAQRDIPSADRVSQIEEIAFGVFDFSTISKLVLARNWKKLSKEQRERFIEEFKLYLSHTYGGRIDRYQGTEIVVYGARVEPRGDVTVLSRTAGQTFAGIEMNYRMRFGNGQWKVIDIVIEGISLVSNFRSQFGEVISRSGPDRLFEQMRAKNAEYRLIDPDEG